MKSKSILDGRHVENKAFPSQVDYVGQQVLLDLLEEALGIIANSSDGDWSKETVEWQVAAATWQAKYRETVAKLFLAKIVSGPKYEALAGLSNVGKSDV